jgi:hypothetical protein
MASGLWTLCAVLDLGEIAEAKAPLSEFVAANPPTRMVQNFSRGLLPVLTNWLGAMVGTSIKLIWLNFPTVASIACLKFPTLSIQLGRCTRLLTALRHRKRENSKLSRAGKLEAASREKKISMRNKKHESWGSEKPSDMENVLAKPLKTSRKHIFRRIGMDLPALMLLRKQPILRLKTLATLLFRSC